MKTNNKRSVISLIIIIVISMLVGGAIMFGILKVLNSSNTGTVITKNGTQVYEKNSLAASVDKVYDAVVTIEGFQSGQLAGTGSGFIYKVDDKYGYVLTNQHVIDDVVDVKILFNSTSEEVEGKILGGDEYLDLAVIRISKEKVKTYVEFGNSDKTKLGDTVFTIGAPMGVDYKGSVTSGILSGKDRMVTVSVKSSVENDWIMKVLQIDAPINPGNSGGPLFNVNGEVIGICSMKLVNAEIEGMGFAIPSEYAKNHIDTLEKGKKIEWPVLGINMINVTDSSKLYRNGITINDNIKEGVVVAAVSQSSAAEKAGLKVGDVIIKMDDNKVKDIPTLRYSLYQHSQGDTMKTTIIRDGKEKTINIKL